MILLDVHILVMDYTPAAYKQRAIESVLAAIDEADYEIALHLVPGIIGSIGQARARGYDQGLAPYVTHVDDDDWVHPSAFDQLHQHLLAGVPGVTTGEVHVHGQKHVPYHDSRHHLAVLRRDRIPTNLFHIDFVPDQHAMKAIPDAVHIPHCLYYHRIDINSGSRKQRREAGHDVVAAEITRLAIDPPLLVAEALTPADIERIYQEEGV